MEKQWYRVAPGVTWVNGARVASSRKVLLTAKEAQYDLDLARIEPLSKRAGARKARG